MAIPDHQEAFQLLIAGILISDYLNWSAPDSPIFGQATNQLACLLTLKKTAVPCSLENWIHLFEEPLSKWWPGDLEDLEIRPEEQLSLMFDRHPEDWLIEYIENRGIDPNKIQKGLISFQSEIDQQGINTLRRWCGETDHPEIYSTYREFLIRNPMASVWQLNTFMIQFNVPIPVKIQSFYEEPSPDRFHNGQLWLCPYCQGVLKWHYGEPYCIRHNVCGKNSDHYAKRAPVKHDPSLRVLKYGSHLRTCVPGIPEIRLYDACVEGQFTGVKEVRLWPGLDTYDLRITFLDDLAWAIDVKDLGKPLDLRKTIDKALGGLYAVKDTTGLEWARAFYVVPDYRLKWTPGYLDIARSDQLTNGESELITFSEAIALIKERAAEALKKRGDHV